MINYSPSAEITPEWLMSLGFVMEHPIGKPPEYYANGLYLSYFDNSWRFQIGGNEGWWKYFPPQTQKTVAILLNILGRDITPEISD